MPRDLPPELDVFLVLHLAAGAAWPLIQREFEAEGVSPGHWGLLVHVGARGRMTPSELAAETGVRTTTVRDQVQALVDRGVLRRVDNPLDARSYFVTLTAQGRRELERGVAASARVRAAIEQEYGSVDGLHAELLRFIAASSRVVERIESAERSRQVEAALETDLAQ
jgi:DNA-binding MarR family transcriptional regulator